MNNRICKLLNIEYPIIQGAMSWISDSNLAAAVSNAGGLGIISGVNDHTNNIRNEIKKIKKLTNKPFGVNIMFLSDNIDELSDIIIEEDVKIVTTGAGNPKKYIEKWKNAGIKIIPVIPSVILAKKMEKLDVDAIIAEGCESGGHIGKLTTMTLIPQVADAVNIPIIAAGGIGDGRSIVAAFALGADAVQVGTRFLVADECKINENYKNAIINCKDTDIDVVGRSTGHPIQIIKNKLSKEFLDIEKENKDIEKLKKITKNTFLNAIEYGDLENSLIMAGQIAGLINKKQNAKDIIEEMFIEFDIIKKKFQI